ncbi:GRAM domain-containing protein [Gilvimarinus polysaccharolyticus]|uniref:GRAM domain-containing protein n=1 Tax=Gilvimarinus polysaccharolyticus TaxID=863921 RepID=UPI0018DBD8E7
MKEGGANLQKNIETVGGELHLTNQRLIFKSHKINIQTGITEIQLSDIKSVKKC